MRGEERREERGEGRGERGEGREERGERRRRKKGKEKREGDETESIGNFNIKWYLHVRNHHLAHPIRLLYLPKCKRAPHMQ